jgi:NADH:ubiquinone oxidoreductase subunit E
MKSCNLSEIDAILEKHGTAADSLIAVLKDIQNQHGYLPQEALRHVSEKLAVPLSKIFCIATFYSSFSLEPKGKNVISVCQGTACHVKKGEEVVTSLTRALKLGSDRKTSPDGAFTVEKVRCMGCCSIAPAVQVNGEHYGQVTQNSVANILRKYGKI